MESVICLKSNNNILIQQFDTYTGIIIRSWFPDDDDDDDDDNDDDDDDNDDDDDDNDNDE